MAATPKLSPLSERQDPQWLMDTILSEFDRLNELRELLSIAEDYCHWDDDSNLVQNLQRVRLLIGAFNLQAEGGIDGLQGFVINLQAVIHHSTAHSSTNASRGDKPQ